MRGEDATVYACGNERDTSACHAPTLQVNASLPLHVQMVVVLHVVMVGVLQSAVVVIIMQDLRWLVMRIHTSIREGNDAWCAKDNKRNELLVN